MKACGGPEALARRGQFAVMVVKNHSDDGASDVMLTIINFIVGRLRPLNT